VLLPALPQGQGLAASRARHWVWQPWGGRAWGGSTGDALLLRPLVVAQAAAICMIRGMIARLHAGVLPAADQTRALLLHRQTLGQTS
jgi:hypothetical protein